MKEQKSKKLKKNKPSFVKNIFKEELSTYSEEDLTNFCLENNLPSNNSFEEKIDLIHFYLDFSQKEKESISRIRNLIQNITSLQTVLNEIQKNFLGNQNQTKPVTKNINNKFKFEPFQEISQDKEEKSIISFEKEYIHFITLFEKFDVPIEIFELISEYLVPRDLISFISISKVTYCHFNTYEFWKTFVKKNEKWIMLIKS